MTLLVPSQQVYLFGPVSYLPPRLLSNEELLRQHHQERGLKTKLDWILSRLGVKERHWVDADTPLSSLAIAAGKALFAEHPADGFAIKQLILATISGDFLSPPSSPFAQEALGLREVGAFDLGAACAGFVSGLIVACAMNTATAQDQLLIAADIRSKFLNPADMGTLPLFGDGAAAAIISQRAERADFRFLGGLMNSDGSVADTISIPAGGSRLPAHKAQQPSQFFLQMKEGPALFIKGVQAMTAGARTLLSKLGKTSADISWLVPHQANLLMVREIGKSLGVPPERVIETISFTGNTSGASVGIAAATLRAKKVVKPGDLCLLVSAGGGGLAATAALEGM